MRDEMIDTMTRTRIDKYANLSTGHLTEEVRLALDATDYERNKGMAPEWRGRLIMMSREYGWFIYIPVLEESLSSEEYAEIPQRSEERREGKECGSTGRYRGSPFH